MKNLLLACFAAPLLLLAPQQTSAQMEQDARTDAEQALSDGDPEQAVILMQKQLVLDPNDFAALFLLSVAQSKLGHYEAAVSAASKAYRIGQDENERLQAARLAGGARFGAGQFTRAQWWLRRAANHASTPDDFGIVQQEFQKTRESNPLSIQLSFSVAPSSNINNGAEQDFFTLEGINGVFGLPPENVALSGVEYAGDIQLTYRLSQNAVQTTSAGAYIFGRTYSLSPKARDRVPELSGRDFALVLTELSLNQRRLLFRGAGSTTIAAHLGKVWYGGDPLWDYQKVSLSHELALGPSAQLTVQASVQDQQALDVRQSDTVIYGLTGLYARRLANRDGLAFTIAAQLNDVDADEATFTDYSAYVDYTVGRPFWQVNWTFSAGLGYKNYDEFFLSLDGRRDRYASLSGTAEFGRISYFGFSPRVTVSAMRTKSNVSQFSNSQIQGQVGVVSNF